MTRRFEFKVPLPRPLKRRGSVPPDAPGQYACGGNICVATRRLVWRRDGGRCRRCGSTEELQFDHIVPRSRGGSGSAANVELLCRRCNLAKLANVAVPTD
jgi:HNH endonuclease